MVVKDNSNPIEKIREIYKSQHGIILTSDLKKYKIPRTYLSILLKKGEIERISRGVYSADNYMVDEMASLQARYKAAIYSHETALYLLNLTDRSPLNYSVTVPSNYNATSLKSSGLKVYFVKRDLYSLGLITMESHHGNEIKTFNLERTICDVLRNRNRIDIQVVNESLKRYVIDKNRNINQLYSFAKQFRIHNIVRDTIEVLL